MSCCLKTMQCRTAMLFLAWCLQSVFSAVLINNLTDFQVLQRTTPVAADFPMNGVCNAIAGSHIQLRVSYQLTGFAVPGFNWVTVDTAISSKTWKGIARGLPVGGEYAFQFRQVINKFIVEYSAAISHVLVGDLWGAAGQSNMQGCGKLELGEPPIDQVHVITLDKDWEKAVEPISGWGCGPAFPFALAIYASTRIPVGLVYYARGATSMDYWQKDSLGFLNWTSVITKAGGRLKGVIWYQGESNSGEVDKALRYKRMTKTFMADMRSYVKNDSLPWILAQIATAYDGNNYDTGFMIVREAQREIGLEDRFSEVITTIDLKRGDPYHFDTPQYQEIGRRFAAGALTKAYGTKLPKGPRFVNAFFLDGNRTTVFITCKDVSGRLVFNSGMNWLFALKNDVIESPSSCVIYGKASVIAHFDDSLPPDALVGFGYGQNPTSCNLSDSTGIPLQPFYNQKIALQGDTSQTIKPEEMNQSNIIRRTDPTKQVRISANPFGLYSIATISFPSIQQRTARLSLYTIGGIPIWTKALAVGQTRCTISRRFLAPGCYVLKVTDGRFSGTAKFIWRSGTLK